MEQLNNPVLVMQPWGIEFFYNHYGCYQCWQPLTANGHHSLHSYIPCHWLRFAWCGYILCSAAVLHY
jgi:hypothetical protein